jgi:alanyl-tRNA synthetase
MRHEELRKFFLDFFSAKKHKIVASSSLISDDPSVLFTTAGMQQFKRYFTGELDALKNFGSNNVISIQKCFRTSDIESVGDTTHLTFFEMMGNFSFGGYFKKETINFAYEFVTQILGISPTRITVSVFSGDSLTGSWSALPFDQESYDIWHKKIGLPLKKIIKQRRQDNFWGPTGDEGPCGPTTEIYVDGVEIWNLVFNEYYQHRDKTLEKLKIPGIDTGMGLERLLAVLGGFDDVFETDVLHPLISKIYELAPALDKRIARILADHFRSIIFLTADGVRSSNKEAGYVLRRLIRRVLAYMIRADIHGDLFGESLDALQKTFGKIYPEIQRDKEILSVLEEEQIKFQNTLTKGLKELKKYKEISAKDAFYLYETFGLPFEIIKEMAIEAAKSLKKEDFDAEFEKHQKISRVGSEKKFGGHGLVLNTSELKAKDEKELNRVIRLHTATHLLQQALRIVLENEVGQRGSDINSERARFDFSFKRKLTPEEIKKIEDLVNQKIQEDLPVAFQEMPKAEAEKTGALYFFKEKYPEKVKVYFIGHSLKDAFSKEFCNGPHVDHTLQIGRLRILKEEGVGAGIRRIKATISE